jgi:hypothetical protein
MKREVRNVKGEEKLEFRISKGEKFQTSNFPLQTSTELAAVRVKMAKKLKQINQGDS